MTSKLFSSALAALVLVSCAGEPSPPPPAVPVEAATTIVQPSVLTSMRSVAGTVRSATVSPLAAKVMGNVVRVHVAEGDRVRAGQLLLEIDSREGKAQARAASSSIAAAEANATLAGATYKRYAALRERNSVSQQELENVQAAAASARAELDRVRSMASEAETFLDYSYVRSPIDGVVTSRAVDPGAQAAPGMPLLTVEDTRAQRVEATVPEDLAVHAGDPAILHWTGGTRQVRVSRVQPSVDAATRGSLVQIDLHDVVLRNGAFVRVLFPGPTRPALTVPGQAIVRRGALTGVYVIGTGNIARLRLLTLGEDDEVLSGLEAGERIVTEPERVTDGALVNARSAS